ncbi:MAG: T9SS type A sorting domain-containing protein [candidate division WOR-3 bacterium]|nr:MAG: T9SS type A sorting domain-containing protein [candidate division WOR-3 bacterium]
MRSMLLVLLVPVLALAVSNMPTVDVVAPEGPVRPGEPVVTQETRIEPGEPAVLVGTVDTVGGTTYDWCGNGPIYRFIVNSPEYGVHVAWMYSAHTANTEFPDRNMRYNFYDYSAGWNWIDPDYMQSGVTIFTGRVGYGNLDADPSSGVAVVPCHIPAPVTHRIDVARDMGPGTGIFEYCEGSPTLEGYLWPPVAVDANGKFHIHCVEDVGDRDNIYYSGGATWCNWTSPIRTAPPQPDPLFPTQNVAASKVSDNVCLTWTYSPTGYSQKPGFYRISTDGGTSWGDPTQLMWPQAYQGDTLTSFHLSSLFPFYDSDDQLHIVAGVTPFVRDTNWILPAEIWHWDQSTDAWSRVHRADPESLLANVGYNASIAGRPSIGEDNRGNLYVAWEEFDGVNYESLPVGRLRGDIWGAGSDDDGATWYTAVRLTGPGESCSNRFPSVIDMAVEGAYSNDTVMILYEKDLHAGFFVQNEGPATNNPIVVHKVRGGDFGVGVKERGKAVLPDRLEIEAKPNPFGRSTVISYALPMTTEVTLAIYDEAGRPVQTLHKGLTQAGRHTATWNASEMPAGVYFYKLHAGDQTLSEKLVVSR